MNDILEPTLDPTLTYASYLLRVWQGRQAEARVWRVSLEVTRTGDRYDFTSLDHLLTFLQNPPPESGLSRATWVGLEDTQD